VSIGPAVQRQDEPNQSEADSEVCEPVYLLTDPITNIEYALTPADYEALKAELVTLMRQSVAQEMKAKALELLDYARTFEELHDDNLVISYFAHAFGGVGIGAATSISDDATAAWERAEGALQGSDIDAAVAAFEAAEETINACVKRMNAYKSDLIGGGEDVITLLRITESAAWAVFTVAGGAALAAPLKGAVAASAVAGAGGGFLQSAANSILPVHYGEKSFSSAAWEAIEAAAVQGGSGAAGGYIAGKISGKVVDGLYAHLGSEYFGELSEEAAKITIANQIEGSLGEAIEGAVADLWAIKRQKATWDDLAQNVVVNLIAGGIAGKFQGHMDAWPKEWGGNPAPAQIPPPAAAGP
jgi:hypothetical protein